MEPVFKLAAKEADIDTRFIMTKMLRKTFISWLIHCKPELRSKIASSAGHSPETMDTYYITYGFKKDDQKDMREEILGWGEA